VFTLFLQGENANSPITVYYGLPRIIETMNSGVNLGATFCLEIRIKKRDAQVGKQGIPQSEKEIAN
jgi:hypothetical protein